jgi:hypothetical protein
MHRAELDDIDRLLMVANTRHGPGGHWRVRAVADGTEHDHLVDPEDAIGFLVGHRIDVPPERPTRRQLAALQHVQLAMRRLAEGDEAAWAGHVTALLARARFRLGLDGQVEPASDGWNGLVESLLPALVGLRERQGQLRICGNDACRWLFFDRSRNGSRRWCDMSACGNRMKTRRYRRRHPAGAATPA